MRTRPPRGTQTAADGASPVLAPPFRQQSAIGEEVLSLVISPLPDVFEAVFLPQWTGRAFCSEECEQLNPRQHRFEVSKKAAQPDPLALPKLPWEER